MKIRKTNPLTMGEIERLPEVIGIEDVMNILNIGKSSAYEIARKKDFPKLPIDKPIRVPKREFLRWAHIEF